jgi:hypothetical protein
MIPTILHSSAQILNRVMQHAAILRIQNSFFVRRRFPGRTVVQTRCVAVEVSFTRCCSSALLSVCPFSRSCPAELLRCRDHWERDQRTTRQGLQSRSSVWMQGVITSVPAHVVSHPDRSCPADSLWNTSDCSQLELTRAAAFARLLDSPARCLARPSTTVRSAASTPAGHWSLPPPVGMVRLRSGTFIPRAQDSSTRSATTECTASAALEDSSSSSSRSRRGRDQPRSVEQHMRSEIIR